LNTIFTSLDLNKNHVDLLIMEVQKKKILRIKPKEEVLAAQQQQQSKPLAPIFIKHKSVENSSPTVVQPCLSVSVSTVPITSNEFLNTLDEKELIAYNIAKSHLGLLFSLERSNCYFEWLNANK
jgi:hypothetical protein